MDHADKNRLGRSHSNMIRAAIRLLGDGSASVVNASRALLRDYGESARTQLQQAGEQSDVPTRMRARDLLRSLDVQGYLRQFAALDLDGPGHRGLDSLLGGTVLASHMVRTFAPDVAELRKFLVSEARLLRARFVGRSLPTCARILSKHLVESLGFRGGQTKQPDLDQVLLDRVLEGRIGIPVSLSLVYVLIGRQAGLTITGIGLPTHFLVRLQGVRSVLVDPFHHGRIVLKTDCVRYLRGLGYVRARNYLRDLTDREMLAYYLRDLRRAAGYRGHRDAQQTLGDALLHLDAK